MKRNERLYEDPDPIPEVDPIPEGEEENTADGHPEKPGGGE